MDETVRLTPEQQQLVLAHMEQVEEVARRTCIGLTLEEKRAAAYYGLCRAARVSAHTDFAAMANRAARRQIINDWRMLHRVGGECQMARAHVFVNVPIECVAEPRESVVDIQDEVDALQPRIRKLGPKQKKLLALWQSGYRWTEAGRKIGVTKQGASKLKIKILRALTK